MESIRSLFFISITFGFVIGLTILLKPSFKSDTNNYLGYAVLTISIIMVKLLLQEFGFYNGNNKLNIICDIEWVLLAPVFIFMFFIKNINHKTAYYKELKLLYVPFMFSLLLNVINNLARDFELFSIENERILRLNNNLFVFEGKLIYLYNFIFLIWLFFILKQSTTKKNSTWLWKLYVVYSLLVLFWFLIDFIQGIFPNEFDRYYLVVLLIAVSFFLYWVSYNTVYRHQLLNEVIEINKILKAQKSTSGNAKIPVSSNPIFERFEKLFKEEYMYRDSSITRESIAEKLDISAGYLSQIINTNIEGNFSSYINQKRVAEVKKMLRDTTFDKYSIEAIGLEAGFSSKTTFYKVFKKSTGMTPQTYKKTYR